MVILDVYPLGKWQLDSLECSSDHKEMLGHIHSIEKELENFLDNLKERLPLDRDLLKLSKVIKQMDSLNSFLFCNSTMQDTNKTGLAEDITELKNKFNGVMTNFKECIINLEQFTFDEWLKNITMNQFQVELESIRSSNDASIEVYKNHIKDNLQNQEKLYRKSLNKLTIPYEYNGDNSMTFHKANNIASTHSNEQVRVEVFKILN